MRLNSAQNLEVYKKAYDLVMTIFHLAKKCPCLFLAFSDF